MFLCIDTRNIKRAYEVQKSLKLEEILLNHTKYFATEEDALKESYVPLDFATSIRSIYSNKVLEIDGVFRNYLYYENRSHVEKCIHQGYDLVMHVASLVVFNQLAYVDTTFNEIMMKGSSIQCLGLLNPDSDFINPIVYTHVIISDECLDAFTSYLKKGRRFIDIKDMKPMGNLPMLLDEIVEVKNER